MKSISRPVKKPPKTGGETALCANTPAADSRLFRWRLFPLVLLLFASCGGQVLGVPFNEAEKRLYAGDIEFVLKARPQKIKELAKLDTAAPFYAGLLAEDYYKNLPADEPPPKGADEKTALLFAGALNSPFARACAANKLISREPDFYYEDSKKKKPASLASATPGSDWAEPFELLRIAESEQAVTESQTANSLSDYFFTRKFERRAELAVAEWLFEYMKNMNRPVLSAFEMDAAAGRLGVAKRDYGPAYRHFKACVENARIHTGETGEELRALFSFFLRYPEALNDFGKALQYGGPLSAGQKMFAEWDARFKVWAAGAENAGDAKAAAFVRYLFNYYQGRFFRASRAYESSAAAFAAALELAPDNGQKDACIWYIIDIYYAQKPEDALPYIKKYAPRWNDASYFDDIFDKLVYYCVSKKKWQNLIDIYPAVASNASEKTHAKYAYIIARALEEGYVKTKAEGITARSLLNAAYRQESDYYYRAMAAKRLSKNPAITKLADAAEMPVHEAELSPKMRFLLDFFRFGCARFAGVYINEAYDSLSIPELRLLARKFTEAGRYGDAIRLVVKYSKRPGFEVSRADLELSYPRAFSDLVERYAKKANIQEHYLYALMRTESIFIPDIVSRAGALGLTQLMPDTGRHMAEILAGNGGPNYFQDDTINLLDPELNIHLGALYFKDMEMRMGSMQTALMAYNGGIGRVRRWKRNNKNMPDDLFAEAAEINETREYSKKVIGDAAVYQFLYW
ncbi:MAG: lytic transglycosylase domain-containing protein [Spirochaetaceae bacterium]|jgi:soluble lytic murein transglycosylase|nr:lytic transglycosylase domain-containing protein [Spirochaetaceae bacterium]